MANGNGVSIGGGRQITDSRGAMNGGNVGGGRRAVAMNILLPKNGGWLNQMTGNLNKSANLRNSAASGGDVTLDVPVRQGDTQWTIVLRSLPLLAKQSGLGAESQIAFAEKWAARLEASGETAIYDNGDSGRIDGGDFAARIDKSKADAQNGGIGTYKLTFTAKNHGAMLADIQQLRRNEILTSGIGDAELRGKVLANINALTVGEGEKRAAAAQDLWRMGQSGQPEAAKVYDSVKTLARYGDLQLNAAVKMTELLLDSDKTFRQFGPYDLKVEDGIRQRLSEITRIAARDDISDNPTGASGKADRAEASFVNREAAALYKKIGDKKAAYEREMIGRFYEAGDRERNTSEVIFGGGIERWKKTDQPSMRATAPEETALLRFNQQNGAPQQPKKDLAEDPQKREYKGKNKYVVEFTRDKDGKLKPNVELKGDVKTTKLPETTFYQDGALRTEGKKIERTIYLNEKGEQVRKGRPYSYEQTNTKNLDYESPVLNPKQVRGVMFTAGAVGGLEEINKWGSFLGDLYNNTTANKVAEREKLQKAAYNATHFPVPPKIEDLPKYRRNFELSFGKQKADVMMKKLEEMSRAFWNK